MAKRGHNLTPDAGKNTQFGKPGGADPSKASKSGQPKWSIRQAVRYLAAQGIDPGDKEALKKLMGKEMSIAEVIALKALQKAMAGDMTAVTYATENIDGKLPQTNINAEYADIVNASDEDLDAIIAAEQRLSGQAPAGDGAAGAKPKARRKGK